MKFEHCDGEDAPARITYGLRDKAEIEDGVFTVDDDRDDLEELIDRLTEAGHEPLDDAGDQEDVSDEGDDTDEDNDVDVPSVSEYSEQQLVEDLDYREKQALAGQYDDINGNASDEKLTEELIKQRRKEVDN